MRHRLVCVVAGSIGRAFLKRLESENIQPGLVVDAINLKQVTTSVVPESFDTLITIGSRAFITAEVRDRGRQSVGFHPSLLPRHKGPHAVAETIKARDLICGGSIYALNDYWDAGAVLAQMSAPVPTGATTRSLWEDVLKPLGVEMAVTYLGDGG